MNVSPSSFFEHESAINARLHISLIDHRIVSRSAFGRGDRNRSRSKIAVWWRYTRGAARCLMIVHRKLIQRGGVSFRRPFGGLALLQIASYAPLRPVSPFASDRFYRVRSLVIIPDKSSAESSNRAGIRSPFRLRRSTGDSGTIIARRRSSRRRAVTINDAVVDLTLRCTYARRQIVVLAFAPRKKKVPTVADAVGGGGGGGLSGGKWCVCR